MQIFYGLAKRDVNNEMLSRKKAKEILRNIPNLDSLIQKYTLRAKRIYDEN